jgi:hypothetical protein
VRDAAGRRRGRGHDAGHHRSARARRAIAAGPEDGVDRPAWVSPDFNNFGVILGNPSCSPRPRPAMPRQQNRHCDPLDPARSDLAAAATPASNRCSADASSAPCATCCCGRSARPSR